MTQIKKSTLTVDDENIAVSFAFTKVDKVNRIVTGVATADNVDGEGDLIDYKASQDAFQTWIGNIREMHGTKAVGKAVNSKEILVRDKDGKQYNGFEVSAYISKGAQDTWEKILDGTLTGFSVGGRILEKAKELHKASNQIVSRITKYLLSELSVVDNPCNPLAQFSMIKGVGIDPEVSDMVASETVFYCEEDEIAKAGESECSVCHKEMQSIGFIESIDDFEVERINKMIENHDLTKGADQTFTSNEGNRTYDYPIAPPEDIRNAWEMFNQGMPRGYDPLRWEQIGNGIASAMSATTGIAHEYNQENGLVEVCGADDKGENVDEDGTVGVDSQHPFPTLKVAGASDEKGLNLQNNTKNDNVINMDLTQDQKQSLLGKFANWLFLTNSWSSDNANSSTITNVLVASNEAEAENITKTTATEADVQEESMEKNESVETASEEVQKGFDLDALASAIAEKLSKGVEVVNDPDSGNDPKDTPGQDQAVGDAPLGWSNRLDEFGNNLRDVTAAVDTLGKRMGDIEERLNSMGAVKKSVDAVADVDEEEDTTLRKSQESDSVWGNVFVPQGIVEALGYKS